MIYDISVLSTNKTLTALSDTRPRRWIFTKKNCFTLMFFMTFRCVFTLHFNFWARPGARARVTNDFVNVLSCFHPRLVFGARWDVITTQAYGSKGGNLVKFSNPAHDSIEMNGVGEWEFDLFELIADNRRWVLESTQLSPRKLLT